MNTQTRIQLTDSAQSAIMKLADGNPGAVDVCVRVLSYGAAIDPRSALGGLGGLLALDTHGIYGSRIWMLYKDVCGQDLTNMLGVLRAVQLGQLRESVMLDAIDGRASLDMESVLSGVRERLPEFGKSAVVA